MALIDNFLLEGKSPTLMQVLKKMLRAGSMRFTDGFDDGVDRARNSAYIRYDQKEGWVAGYDEDPDFVTRNKYFREEPIDINGCFAPWAYYNVVSSPRRPTTEQPYDRRWLGYYNHLLMRDAEALGDDSTWEDSKQSMVRRLRNGEMMLLDVRCYYPSGDLDDTRQVILWNGFASTKRWQGVAEAFTETMDARPDLRAEVAANRWGWMQVWADETPEMQECLDRSVRFSLPRV